MSTRLNLTVATVMQIVLAGAAVAQSDEGPRMTREAVIAEVRAAQADGTLGVLNQEDGGSHWMAGQPFQSTQSRNQVLADARAAHRSGLIQAIVGEVSPLDLDSFWLAPGTTQFAGLHRWRAASEGLGSPQRTT